MMRSVLPDECRGGEMGKRLITILLGFALLALVGLTGCDEGKPPDQSPASKQQLAQELTFYNWAGDMPQSVLDAFTREYGVKVNYVSYESQEDAIANLRAGQVYDVVVMESRSVPILAQEGLLAELNHANLTHLKNIAANFRDLTYDPGNRYCIPYNWGTTGLVVRSDLA
ncbi:MAG TPA: extracellular solute-binding protein, partial [Xanthomonadaceae bacterium]|nr:extracellular solute-binding protein [Xanthomonadaceae bacterium]